MGAKSDLSMFVLDAMQDDVESLDTVVSYLNAGWQSARSQGFTAEEVLPVLKDLVLKGHVSVFEERDLVLHPVGRPSLVERDLRRYWYAPTAEGRRVWGEWEPPPLPDDDDGPSIVPPGQWTCDDDYRACTITVHAEDLPTARAVLEYWRNRRPEIALIPGKVHVGPVSEFRRHNGTVVSGGVRLQTSYRLASSPE